MSVPWWKLKARLRYIRAIYEAHHYVLSKILREDSWPQWTYERKQFCFPFMCYYWFVTTDEPINVVLTWTSWPQTGLIYDLRDWLLTQGYTNAAGCANIQWVYDEVAQEWRSQDVTLMAHGDCFSSYRRHNRMWALANGFDAVHEHYEHLHIDWPPHQVHSWEVGEGHLAYHADLNPCYIVNQDNYWLDNYLADPYNDGYATKISFLSGC